MREGGGGGGGWMPSGIVNGMGAHNGRSSISTLIYCSCFSFVIKIILRFSTFVSFADA